MGLGRAAGNGGRFGQPGEATANYHRLAPLPNLGQDYEIVAVDDLVGGALRQ